MTIDELRIPEELKEMLKNTFNISTVKQLLEISCKDLYRAMEDPTLMCCKSYYSPKTYQRALSNSIHMLGYCLRDEYEDINLPLSIAFLKISDLDMSTTLKKILIKRAEINTLGELLTYDYEDLKKLRGMGVGYLQELKDYVRGIGYSLMNEKPSVNEMKYILKEQGLKILEDEGIPTSVCGYLYRNNIFTIEDLISCGPEVFNISGLGTLKKQILVDSLLALGIDLNAVDSSRISPTMEIIQQLRAENTNIEKTIERKGLLADEYAKLMEEKRQLLQRELELDARIQELSNELESIKLDRKRA